MPLAIPKSEGVQSTFKQLIAKLEGTRKKINSLAAKQMKKDEYDAAEKWMEIGRSVADFGKRARAFAEEWKRLTKATKLANAKPSPNLDSAGKAGPKRTPIWKFCVPALRALAAGEEMTLDQVLAGVEKQMASVLTAKDLALSGDKPKWHATVARAHRQCQREGWIEKRRDGLWKITPKGKAVASSTATGVGAAMGQGS